nr:hypothetical protein [Tanacetum cinerariifolium]GFD12730.1 hypothetical protein [Tanacetum cinerariifolium]
CASCKVFGHIHEECPKNTSAGEKKTLKKPSQTSRGVPIGPEMSFKPQKEYRPVPKKATANSSCNKKKGVEPTIEIRNNPLILKKWHPSENLLKEDVSTIPIWVKLHGVPVTAFSEDGLSAIATKV